MVYPHSPFKEEFNISLISQLYEDATRNVMVGIQNEDLNVLLKWLCSTPNVTTYRINTLKCNKEELLKIMKTRIRSVEIISHKIFPEVVYWKHGDTQIDLKKHKKEIIVDSECGAAILRGAHIFVPGVIAMVSGCQINDSVSVFVDAVKKCKKGYQKIYNEKKIFVANGICRLDRAQLFVENSQRSGIAIQITETISGYPSISDEILPKNWALLQNLPSIICVNILDPRPYDTIIDMCAAPGNKTTHIAQLTKNKGILVALDKTPAKVEKLKRRCQDFGAEILAFHADSTKIHTIENIISDPEQGPPFASRTFNKVLLDAPCSAMGKRPQFLNNTSEKMIRSYVPLQRRLFDTAVKILKVHGTLVYSTCTITLAENEGVVAWALKTFPCLELEMPNEKLCLGEPGWPGTSLTAEQRQCIQRFGPRQELDSVGFFVARFIKRHNNC